MNFFPRRLLLLALLALSGCASLPQPEVPPEPEAYYQHMQRLADIAAFSISGRMAVQTEQRGFSGSLKWKHTEEGEHFALYSPLGTQVADITFSVDGVFLTTSERKTYTAEDAETLLQQTMGWSLPLNGLTDWVLGRPAPSAYDAISWDEHGRITLLKQDGWEIEYPGYREVDGTDLPAKILLRSPKLNLKLLVEQWGTLAQEE